MKWENVTPDIQHCDFSRVTHALSASAIIKLISIVSDGPFVVIGADIYAEVKRHLSSYRVESGGLLVGKVHSLSSLYQDLIAIEITSIAPSLEFDGTAVSLRMSSSVWNETTQIRSNDEIVVGWYHSHPDLGAFFSGTDRATQKRFFSNAFSIGLVVDPIRNEEKWFRTGDSVEVARNKVLRSLPWVGAGKNV